MARRLIEEEEWQRPHPERPRREQGIRAGAGADGGGRPAPLPDPRGPAHAREPRAPRPARAREVHHFSLLIGYGVSVINPYLAFETIRRMIDEGLLPGVDYKTACKNFVKAASKGVIKVASKMGISSLQSYRGAQVFEAVGLRQDVIDEYFSWTASPRGWHRHGRDRPGSA